MTAVLHLGVARATMRAPVAPALLRGVHATAAAPAQGPRAPRARMPMPAAPAPERPKPASPAYFTTEPSYIDTLHMLDKLTREVKRELELACVLPLNSRPPPLPQGPTNIWLSREALRSKLGTTLRASQHRSVISRLTLLLRYRALVLEHFAHDAEVGAWGGRSTAAQKQLAQQVEAVFAEFFSPHGKAQDEAAAQRAAEGSPARGMIDEQGRAYARGRRKESSARVWLVKTKEPDAVGSILVNNAPISQYFTRTDHREAVTWPLKLAGVLGVYTVSYTHLRAHET